MTKVFLVICFILLPTSLLGQTFTRLPVDSVCTLIYDGKMWLPPLPPPPLPPHLYSSLKQAELNANYQKTLLDVVGEIDTTREMSHFSQNVIDKNGKFNPTIIWESKKCYNLDSLGELERILTCGKEIARASVPAKCFFPRHSILLYKNDEVVAHYDICFECTAVKLNREKYIRCIDMIVLREFFIYQGYPIEKIIYD